MELLLLLLLKVVKVVNRSRQKKKKKKGGVCDRAPFCGGNTMDHFWLHSDSIDSDDPSQRPHAHVYVQRSTSRCQ